MWTTDHSEVASSPSSRSVAARKDEHLELARSGRAVSGRSPGWDDVHLVPSPLPELARGDVDLRTRFLGHELAAPIVIAGMTGGHPDATEINARLGAAAERLGIAVGVGSQRAALRDPSLASSYAAIRRHAPTAFVLANVGACQLVPQRDVAALTSAQLRAAVDMVGAQALAIHLNALEEAIQPEGDDSFAGVLDAIARAARELPVPVVAKETGAGMTREAALALADRGVAAIDVGGAGGTSFARIERDRAEQQGDALKARLGATFCDWGVPTAAAILESRAARLPLIATGGVRTGLDAAKALALGADLAGVGRLALLAAGESADALDRALTALIEELRVALLLSGARGVADLRRRPPVLTGFVGTWSAQRGLS